MSESTLNPEIKEIEPRVKVLIIDVQPGTKQNVRISQELFGSDADSIEKFSQLAVTSIHSPKRDVEPDFNERERKSLLHIPDSVEDFAAIVVTGSPYAAYPRDTKEGLFLANWKNELFRFIRAANEHSVPFLGICFGEHALAEALGGKVVKMRSKKGAEVAERAWGEIRKAPAATNDPLLKDLPSKFVAPENHEDIVARLPEGATLLAENEYGVQGFRIGNSWGFEFHSERRPDKVKDFFKDKENLDELKRQGKKPSAIQKLGEKYDATIRSIFSNFLKLAWSGVQ